MTRIARSLPDPDVRKPWYRDLLLRPIEGFCSLSVLEAYFDRLERAA